MPWITSHAAGLLDRDGRYQAYCCMDTCLTYGVHEALIARADEVALRTYAFSRAQSSIAMEMWANGIAVDKVRQAREAKALGDAEARVEAWLQRLAAAWGLPACNPRSPAQVKALLFGATGEAPYLMRRKRADGTEEWSETADDDHLRKLAKRNRVVGVMALAIIRCRELRKQLGYLRARTSPDGRMRSSFNVAATEMGRWSFSKDPFRDGLNFGNVPKERRTMFVASPGHVMCNVDFKAAESELVAFLADDPAYIEVHKGDPHTGVARLLFQRLYPDWPEPGSAAEAAFVRQVKLRGKVLRQHGKSAQHGCLTPDHEVLTPHGWLPILEARALRTPIMVDGVGFETPSAWYYATLQEGEELIEFSGIGYSQCVTEAHNMPTQKGMVQACHLNKTARLQRCPRFDRVDVGYGVDQREARLAAVLFADGCEHDGKVVFHFRKPRKIERLRGLCAGIPYAEYKNADGTVIFEFADFPVRKLPAGPHMLTWSIGCLAAYIDECRYWDAHTTDRVCHISTTDAAHAEWVHTFAHLIGYGSRRYVRRERSGNRRTLWHVSLNRRRWARVENMQVTRFLGRGAIIVCPVTTTGRFIVRRNGEISVSGNTNYGMTPTGAAELQMIPLAQAKADQAEYFRLFPGIAARINGMTSRLYATGGVITTPLGRRRQFFGRPTDPHTTKEALQFEPGSMVADLMFRATLRLRRDPRATQVRLLNNNYDSLLLECPEHEKDALEPVIREAFADPITIGKHSVQLRIDLGWGRNWAEAAG